MARNCKGVKQRTLHKILYSLEVDVGPECVVKCELKANYFSPSTSFFIQNMFTLNCSHKYNLLKGRASLLVPPVATFPEEYPLSEINILYNEHYFLTYFCF